MPPTRRTAVLALLLCGALSPKAGALERGLVTTHRDSAGTEVVALEPAVALELKAGEAPHPRLRADGRTVWKGLLTVPAAGAYRFHADLRGRLVVHLGGKKVLAAEAKDEARASSAEWKLGAGPAPLVVEFTRLPGAARARLLWQGPDFRTEPVPFDALAHRPAEAPPALAGHRREERGRLLVEELGCVRCHQPSDKDRMAAGLVERPAPDLSQVGQRLHPGWVERWLASPRKLRPTARMPELFGPDEAVERYAVTRYLASLGGPVDEKGPAKGDARRGELLFERVGCSACHAAAAELSGMGSKTTARRLSAFLLDPLATHPAGRMPNMLLRPGEADDLAAHLCRSTVAGLPKALPPAPPAEKRFAAFRRVDDRPDELADFRKLAEAEQWLDLGKRVVIARGCNNCHTIAPEGRPFAAVAADAGLDDVRKPGAPAGCLAEGPKGKAPRFDLSKDDRAAVRAFLARGLTGAGSPAPAHAARLDLERFNCLACHTRHGEGGLPPAAVERARRREKADSAEAVVPPSLTGVGHRLRTPWLREVLEKGSRARPWFGLRMPQFGAANVGKLPEALAALEAAGPDDRGPPGKPDVAAGRTLVGKRVFNCAACHDLAGTPGAGARGPDLASMTRRVRYEWYLRWLEQPQRLAPGTRMPQVFPGGKSLVEDVLGGSAPAQAAAMWAYLSLGPRLPLPEGVEGKRPRPGRRGRSRAGP